MLTKISKTLLATGIVAFLATGCSKNETVEQQPEQFDGKKLAQEFTTKSYQKLDKMNKGEMLSFYTYKHDQVKNQLSGLMKTNTAPEPLEDAFLSLEGLTNGNFSEILGESGEFIATSVSVEMDIIEQGGLYFVNSTDFNNAYIEIQNSVSDYLNINTDEQFVILDLEIEEITPDIGKVVISGNLLTVPTTNPDLWFTPAAGYYGGQLAGVCSVSGPSPYTAPDAAVFISAYANSSLGKKCPNGIAYANPVGILNTFNDTPNTMLWNTPTYNTIANHFWKSNTNDCLGNNNAEWYGLYSEVQSIVNIGLTAAQAKPGGANADFYYTDYHSHFQNSPMTLSTYITEENFHGGDFIYSVITCNP